VTRPVVQTLVSVLVVLSLSGCFRRIPYFMLDVEEEPPLTPAVARWFTELDEARYPELQEHTGAGVPLEEFLFRHEVGRFTQERTTWGSEPELELVLFSDTDHPETYRGAEAAWFLASESTDGVERIRAVLFRQFADAPEAADPVQLLTGLDPAFEAPWTLCQPWNAEAGDFLVAHGQRGVKLGLFFTPEPQEHWAVDHVEFVSRSTSMEAWSVEKGYGGCTVQGRIDAGGRYEEASARRLSETSPSRGSP